MIAWIISGALYLLGAVMFYWFIEANVNFGFKEALCVIGWPVVVLAVVLAEVVSALH